MNLKLRSRSPGLFQQKEIGLADELNLSACGLKLGTGTVDYVAASQVGPRTAKKGKSGKTRKPKKKQVPIGEKVFQRLIYPC